MDFFGIVTQKVRIKGHKQFYLADLLISDRERTGRSVLGCEILAPIFNFRANFVRVKTLQKTVCPKALMTRPNLL